MRIIALGGYKGTGKTTLAKTLVHIHGFVRMSFADPIYDMILAGFGIDGRVMTTDQKEATIEWLGVSLRYLMQTLGTEWGRNTICQDIWIRIMQRKLDVAKKSGYNVVIDDARFPNEVEMVQAEGGIVFETRRYSRPVEPPTPENTDLHSSEKGIAYCPNVRQFVIPHEPDGRKQALRLEEAAIKLLGQCPQTR